MSTGDEYELKDQPPIPKRTLSRPVSATNPTPSLAARPATPANATAAPVPATETTKPKSPKGPLITLIVMLTPLIAFAAFMAIRQTRQEAAQAQWVQQAAGELIFTPVQRTHQDPVPRLVKAVMLDVDKRELYSSHLIPDSLQAKAKEECTTVIWCRNQDRSLGNYENSNATAVLRSCDMTAVDLASHLVIDHRTFNWGEPPKSIPTTWGGTVVGDPPADSIAQWIKGMQ